VRRSVVPRPADAAELAPVTRARTASARPVVAALGLLAVGAAVGFGLQAPRPAAPPPAAPVARTQPLPVVTPAPVAPAPLAVAEAALVAEAPVAPPPAVRRRRRHRAHRPMFASADRYTLIILP
jgi:hypothetical protein